MKKYYIYSTLLLIGMLGFLSGCQEDVDLTNIDTSSELNIGIASPVGSISIAVSDIMLNAVGSRFGIDQDGTITYRDTSHFALKFQDFDWTKYAYKTSKVFEMPDIPGFIPGISLPFDLELPLEFDFALELKDLNIDPTKERFDSLLLDYILLSSKINQRDMNLQWDWVDSIVINLGPQCNRPAGRSYVVYKNKKYDESYVEYGFGTPIPSNVDNFSICLMKDRSLVPGKNTLDDFNKNVVDTVEMQLGLYVTVPKETVFTMGSNAAILYDLNFQGLQPQALWGYFEPAESMKIKDSLDIFGSWDIGELLSTMKLPFAEPEIQFDIKTQLAANWELSSDMIYTTNSLGEKAWANFNGQRFWKKPFELPEGFDLGSSTIGQVFTYSFMFNNTDSLGHIDSLFTIHPERLVYQFAFNFLDPERYPQVRITSETGVNVEMKAKMPMAFNKDVYIEYKDTIKNIDFNLSAEDSSLVKEAKLYLVLSAQNDLPVTLTTALHFLDENGKELKVFDKPVSFTAKDSSRQELLVDEKNINQITATKSISIELSADDKALQDNDNNYPIRLTKDQCLKLAVGFVGSINATLN